MAFERVTAGKVLLGIERFVERIVDIVVVLLLLIGLYYVYDSSFVLHKASADVSAFKPAEGSASALGELSEDCVAWITLYSTNVDYPVMQGSDNMEYLNKDPFGAYSLTGSIFLDSRNDGTFKDDYSVLYGHHVEGGRMFGALDAFEDRTYFAEHRDGELVVDGEFHKIKTFAFTKTEASEGLIFNPDRPGDRLEWIEDNAAIFEKPEGQRIVALTTCTTATSMQRTIVFASILN